MALRLTPVSGLPPTSCAGCPEDPICDEDGTVFSASASLGKMATAAVGNMGMVVRLGTKPMFVAHLTHLSSLKGVRDAEQNP